MENLLVPIAFFTILIPCDVTNTKSFHDCTRDIKSHTNNKHGNYDNYMHRSPWHCSYKTVYPRICLTISMISLVLDDAVQKAIRYSMLFCKKKKKKNYIYI